MHVATHTYAIIQGVIRLTSWTSATQLGRGARRPSLKKDPRESVWPALLYLTFRGVGTVQKGGMRWCICEV